MMQQLQPGGGPTGVGDHSQGHDSAQSQPAEPSKPNSSYSCRDISSSVYATF